MGSPSDDQDDSRKRKRTVGQVPLVQTVFISPDRKVCIHDILCALHVYQTF